MSQSKPGQAHIVWHRAELRVHDQPALAAALELARADGGIVVPVVVVDETIFDRPDLTPRRKAWFLENVAALRQKYQSLGADLLVGKGKPVQVISILAKNLEKAGFQSSTIHYVRNYTPYATQRDSAVGEALGELGIEVIPHPGLFI